MIFQKGLKPNLKLSSRIVCVFETQRNILIEEKDQLSEFHTVLHALQICLVSRNHPHQTVPNQQLLMKSRQGNVMAFPVTAIFSIFD